MVEVCPVCPAGEGGDRNDSGQCPIGWIQEVGERMSCTASKAVKVS